MESKPLVSIIIINNYSCCLAAAIESASNQTYLHTEAIAVDGGYIGSFYSVVASYMIALFL